MAIDLSRPKLQTQFVPFDSPNALREVAHALRNGFLTAFPTDTVYAFGAVASDMGAVDELYRIKQRSLTKPITIMVRNMEQLEQVATNISPLAQKLIDRFWPGALTLILPRNPNLPTLLGGGGNTVAVRMPGHVVTLALLREVGAPLAATSANLSGKFSPLDAQEAALHLEGKVKFILDAGPCPGGVDATVVDACGNGLKVLRETAISARDVRQALEE